MMNDFNKKFVETANEYFISRNGSLKLDDQINRYYNILSLYFSGSKNFEQSFKGKLNKGLFVAGNCGVGKTSGFKILQQMWKKTNDNRLWLKSVSCHQVVQEYNLNTDSKSSIINYYSKGTILFDDLGSEPIASNYGKEDIFRIILELRYESFCERGVKTFITTNLSLEEITTRYGYRVYDRFKEMFNFVKVEGESKRI